VSDDIRELQAAYRDGRPVRRTCTNCGGERYDFIEHETDGVEQRLCISCVMDKACVAGNRLAQLEHDLAQKTRDLIEARVLLGGSSQTLNHCQRTREEIAERADVLRRALEEIAHSPRWAVMGSQEFCDGMQEAREKLAGMARDALIASERVGS